jgi:hypothetical protein
MSRQSRHDLNPGVYTSGYIMPPLTGLELPLSLLEALCRTDDPCQDFVGLLRFLLPITVLGRPLIEMSRRPPISRRGCVALALDQNLRRLSTSFRAGPGE